MCSHNQTHPLGQMYPGTRKRKRKSQVVSSSLSNQQPNMGLIGYHPQFHPPCCPTHRNNLGLLFQVLPSPNYFHWGSLYSLGRKNLPLTNVEPCIDHTQTSWGFYPTPILITSPTPHQHTFPTSWMHCKLSVLPTQPLDRYPCGFFCCLKTSTLLPLRSSQHPPHQSPPPPALLPWCLVGRGQSPQLGQSQG